MSEENNNYYAFITNVFRILLSLVFGIAESVILLDNKKAIDGCSYFWICILLLCIFHYLSTVIQCSLSEEESNKLGILYLVSICLVIWAIVAFNGLKGDCKKYYVEGYPDLYNVLYAEVICAYIGFAILVLLLIVMYCVLSK